MFIRKYLVTLAAVGTSISAWNGKKTTINSTPVVNEDPSVDAITQFLDGVGIGLGLPKVDGCLQGAESLGIQMGAAFELLKNKDAVDTARALRLLSVAMVEYMPTVARDCGASEESIEQLLIPLHILSDPKEFLAIVEGNLTVHGISVLEDAHSAYKAFEASDWEGAGEAVGHILKLLLEAPKVVAVPKVEGAVYV